MKDLVEKTVGGIKLSIEESDLLMRAILSEQMPLSQVAAVLTAMNIHGVSVDMLDGFSRSLLEMATPINLQVGDLCDVCGTGGDGKNSFNISTTVAFVLAGAGLRVAKHGNSAVSSRCGSSNVLEALGITLSADVDFLRRSIERTSICFIHAPLFHPALKRVGPLRKELGFRTVFNALGPLVNPARPSFQYSGVYSLELQRLYGYLLKRRDARFAVVHALDGYDELSLTGTARVVAHSGTREFTAEDFGVASTQPAELTAPETPEASARLIYQILEGKGSKAQTDVVVANAALAMYYAQSNQDLSTCQEHARESIMSLRALKALEGSRTI